MSDTIQAIETSYAGCRFRSRLEARWAVFFDSIGARWQYEPQGFELPSGARYLPDFYLPNHDLWVEVKGDEKEFVANGPRYAEAAVAMGGTGVLILGPVPDTRAGMPQHFVLTPERHCCGETILCLHIAWIDMLRHPEGVREYGLPCTDLMSHEPGRLPALKGFNGHRARYTDPGPIVDWPFGPEDEKPYIAARSARFEHGGAWLMPRIRTIKPDFWSDSKMVRLSPYARLFFIGMWNFALCDKGHLPDDPDELKLKILPADPVDPDELIAELIKLDRVRRMVTRGGETFLWAVRLDHHQKVDTRWNSRCPYCAETDAAPVPPPETHSNSRGTHRVSPELAGVYVSAGEPSLPETPASSGVTRLVREGKGREGKELIPPTAGSLALVRTDPPDSTQPLIGEWLEHCRKRPPGSVIGQVGKQVKAMLEEGIHPQDVRAGLAAWWRKGLHPSALPSVVNELMNATPALSSPAAGLVERNGLQLKPETATRLDDRQKWRDRDAASQQLAPGGTA